MSFRLFSIGRNAEDDCILDESLWGHIDVLHNRNIIEPKKIGFCIITFTNNKAIISDILKNTGLLNDYLDENYIYYGNFLYTPKENFKKDFESNITTILNNVRKSDFWLDIIGINLTFQY